MRRREYQRSSGAAHEALDLGGSAHDVHDEAPVGGHGAGIGQWLRAMQIPGPVTRLVCLYEPVRGTEP
jgi:hypothetical protein